MSIVTTPKGEELEAFYPGKALVIADDSQFPVPLSFAVMIARHEGKTLFVFNSWRQEWELPAGGIEVSETPDLTARRELKEETNQTASSLSYAGLVLLRLPPDRQFELGAAYRAEIDSIQPFQANDEASAIMFWDLHNDVEGHVNQIGRWLAQRI